MRVSYELRRSNQQRIYTVSNQQRIYTVIKNTVKTHFNWNCHYNPLPGYIGMPQYSGTHLLTRLVLHGQKMCSALLWHVNISGPWVIVEMPF